MRSFAVFLIFCLMAKVAPAQSASDYRIAVGAYGLVSGTDGALAGMDSGGIPHYEGGRDHIAQVTKRIPACIGKKFGFEFWVDGALAGAPASLTAVYRFPLPGLRWPGVQSPIHEAHYTYEPLARMHRKIISYKFDRPWELVPGEWTIEIRDDDRVVASETFAVVPPQKGECPALIV